MKQDKWIEQLHDKLAEHETAAPDNLWEDIESALNQRQHRHARIVALRRWTAAAAAAVAILIVSVIGSKLIWNDNMEMIYADEELSEEVAEIPETTIPTTPDVSTSLLALSSKPAKPSVNDAQTPHESPIEELSEEPLPTPSSDEPDMQSEAETAETHDASQAKETVTRTKPLISTKPLIITKTHRTKHTPSVSLYAMNGLGTYDNSNAVFMADALVKSYTGNLSYGSEPAGSRQSTIYLSGYEEHQHHQQPIAFGISVAYPLNHRLSLTSGIVYTKLRSDFSQAIYSQLIQKEQTLHYVGIPMGLSYRIWEQGSFKAYVAAGMQADWNVSAQLNTEGAEQTISRDRMQWSVNSSLGLQYDITPRLSLYAEPGINYHFDNGSTVRNFFKDKPTNLKLQIGVRLNLNKGEH